MSLNEREAETHSQTAREGGRRENAIQKVRQAKTDIEAHSMNACVRVSDRQRQTQTYEYKCLRSCVRQAETDAGMQNINACVCVSEKQRQTQACRI